MLLLHAFRPFPLQGLRVALHTTTSDDQTASCDQTFHTRINVIDSTPARYKRERAHAKNAKAKEAKKAKGGTPPASTVRRAMPFAQDSPERPATPLQRTSLGAAAAAAAPSSGPREPAVAFSAVRSPQPIASYSGTSHSPLRTAAAHAQHDEIMRQAWRDTHPDMDDDDCDRLLDEHNGRPRHGPPPASMARSAEPARKKRAQTNADAECNHAQSA